MKTTYMNTKFGNPSKDQRIIFTPEATYFSSYNTLIVKQTVEDGKRVTYLDEYYWNYSATTGKYRNDFLGENINGTRKKIKSGEYILCDLTKESL